MKICVYNAISIDGYIADKNMSSEWVSDVDWKIFEGYIREYETIIMGRNTWEDAKQNFGTGLNIIFTNSTQLHKSNSMKTVFTNKDIASLLNDLEEKGINKALLIGGGNLNAQFIELGLIDELVIDIHPIIIGQGVPLFSGSKKIESFVFQRHQILTNGQVILKYIKE